MSEAPDATEVEAPEVIEAPVEDNPLDALENAAKAGGWVPRADFKGDADKWLDAPTFVLKAAEILPHVSAALKESKAELRDFKKTLATFAEHHNKTEQRAYERALMEIQGRIDASASVGDVAGVRAATDELVELRQDAVRAPVPQEPEAFTAWKAENPWFGKDKALTAAAGAIGDELVADGIKGDALVREVDKRLRAEFPAKFENPNRKGPPSVEGGGAPPRKQGKGYSDLPADARAMCDDFVKRGVITRERYAKDFFA